MVPIHMNNLEPGRTVPSFLYIAYPSKHGSWCFGFSAASRLHGSCSLLTTPTLVLILILVVVEVKLKLTLALTHLKDPTPHTQLPTRITPFLEHHVSAENDLFLCWIIEPVTLCFLSISNENALYGFRIEVLPTFIGNMGIRTTPKHMIGGYPYQIDEGPNELKVCGMCTPRSEQSLTSSNPSSDSEALL